MITQCPTCQSKDIDLKEGVCRECGNPLTRDPIATVYPPIDRPVTKEPVAIQGLQKSTEAMENADSEEERTLVFNKWEDEVIQYYKDGFGVVTLIGFSGAGKTFFANRLRQKLDGDWTVDPPHKETIPSSSATIEWTQLMKNARTPRLRMIADCDGEAYSHPLKLFLEGSGIDYSLRRFALITAIASAYILMLPAAELTDRRAHEETNRLIERFGMIVMATLAVKRLVHESGGDIKKAVRKGLTREYITEAARYEFDCKQPIHVLFAQADKLKADERCDDPHLFALTHAKKLYETIESRFTNFRYDFVCAFEGHQKNDGARVDYELPSYGTVAAFDWIDRMIEGGRGQSRVTAAAMKARRLFDGTFRKMSARAAG